MEQELPRENHRSDTHRQNPTDTRGSGQASSDELPPVRKGWEAAREMIAAEKSRWKRPVAANRPETRQPRKTDKDLVLRARLAEALTSSEREVLEWLAQYANKNNVAWPSNRTLMGLTGLSRATLARCLLKLENEGLIERNPTDVTEHPGANKGYQTTVYRLRLDHVRIDGTGVRVLVTWARRTAGLTESQRSVLVSMANAADSKGVVCAPRSELAADAGVSVRTWTTAMRVLIARKLVEPLQPF